MHHELDLTFLAPTGPIDADEWHERLSAPLTRSSQPLMSNLLAAGWEIRKVRSTFCLRYPTAFCDRTSGFTIERNDYSVGLGADGFLRLRYVDGSTWEIALIYIHPERQGKGAARRWLPTILKSIFDSGTEALVGMPTTQTRLRCSLPLDQKRLCQFYERHGFRPIKQREEWFRLDADQFATAQKNCFNRR